MTLLLEVCGGCGIGRRFDFFELFIVRFFY